MCVAKTKLLISFAVTAKLICVFVFAYAKSRFSHDAALMNIIDIQFLIFSFSFTPWYMAKHVMEAHYGRRHCQGCKWEFFPS